MYSATQASSSSRSNSIAYAAIDALQARQMPLAGSSHGPIAHEKISKNTSESGSSNEALSELDTNACRKNAKESKRGGETRGVATSALGDTVNEDRETSPSTLPRSPSRSSQPEGDHTAIALQSPSIHLARIAREIQELYELDSRQGEEIKALSEQLFAAAWQGSMSMPKHRCQGGITDLLGEGVGQLIYLDGRHLQREGKLPERSPSWDFGDLVPGPALPRGTEKRRLEEAHEEVVQAESLPSGSSTAAESEMPSDACSPMKRRRLETERAFTSQEVSWAAQVFEEEESGPQGNGGDDTDPDSDGTEPDSDGTEPDDDAEGSTAPRASTSAAPFNQPVSPSPDTTHSVATQQKPKVLQRASTSYDLSFNGSLPALPPTPTTPRPKPKQKVRPQNIPAPYSQAVGTWQEKGVLERCWDGWGYIDGRLYLDARNEVSRDRMATEWIDRMI